MKEPGTLQEKWDALPEWVRKLVGKYKHEWEDLPDEVRQAFSSEEGQEKIERAFNEYTKDVHGEFR